MNPGSESHDEADAVSQAPEVPVATAAHTETKRGLLVRFKNYIWDWRAVVAVGLAMLVVGGLAGLALGLAMDHGGGRGHGGGIGHGPGGHMGHSRPGEFGPGGPMRGQGGPGAPGR